MRPLSNHSYELWKPSTLEDKELILSHGQCLLQRAGDNMNAVGSSKYGMAYHIYSTEEELRPIIVGTKFGLAISNDLQSLEFILCK